MRSSFLLVLALSVALPATGWSEPTPLVVRVLAHDAKLIGSAAGGARVVVRERDTGRILDEGLHRGGTGSTERIIEKPWVRGESRFDTEGAARFETVLELDRPTWVTVEATAPLGTLHHQATASRSFLMLPGRAIAGDGIVLELSGLIVNLLSPHPETKLRPGSRARVEVGVKLLCTCPIYEGSLWDAKDYRVEAELWQGDQLLTRVPLAISKQENVFAGEIEIPAVAKEQSATFELRVTAGNDQRANFGADTAFFRVSG